MGSVITLKDHKEVYEVLKRVLIVYSKSEVNEDIIRMSVVKDLLLGL